MIKIKNLTTVCKENREFEKLIRAAVQQLGGTEQIPQILKGGIDGGFHGFISNNEIGQFFRVNKKQIMSYLQFYEGKYFYLAPGNLRERLKSYHTGEIVEALFMNEGENKDDIISQFVYAAMMGIFQLFYDGETEE